MTRTSPVNLPILQPCPTAVISGIPSFRAYYVVYLASELWRRLFGEIKTMGFNDASDMTLDLLHHPALPCLLYSDIPDSGAAKIVAGMTAPLLIVPEDIGHATRQFMQARGADAANAAITISRCYAAVEQLRLLSRAVTIPFTEIDTALDLAQFVALTLGISSDQWLTIRDALYAECGLERPVDQAIADFSATAIAGWVEPGEHDKAILLELKTAYNFTENGDLTRVRVPSAMILDAKPPHHPALNDLDLTGPARCLTFGPYLSLPTGTWRAIFEFEARENDSTNTLEFDIAANGALIRSDRVTLRTNGRFALTVPFRVEESSHVLEFRTHLMAGAIAGRFKLASIEAIRSALEIDIKPAIMA